MGKPSDHRQAQGSSPTRFRRARRRPARRGTPRYGILCDVRLPDPWTIPPTVVTDIEHRCGASRLYPPDCAALTAHWRHTLSWRDPRPERWASRRGRRRTAIDDARGGSIDPRRRWAHHRPPPNGATLRQRRNESASGETGRKNLLRRHAPTATASRWPPTWKQYVTCRRCRGAAAPENSIRLPAHRSSCSCGP
ncbi:hypothetical protein DSL92_01465 [Billgrantia gudaonensis]|uniref:Uncharacterized protein n=1 Tax=Billgrantia gudaonensis TaxID=376427 RepID=A0A3S0NEJ4_9GAMM|nr:hypothetical protein DSL92_01465 [Halomonas gudaonensis]